MRRGLTGIGLTRFAIAGLAVSAVLAACTALAGTPQASTTSAGPPAKLATRAAEVVSGGRTGTYLVPAGIHKIKHVIIIMQENRSFDSYFGTFPGADGIPMQGGKPTVCVPTSSGGCTAPWGLRDHLGEARSWIDQLLPTADSLEPHARAELLWTAAVTALEVVGEDQATPATSQRLESLLARIRDDPYMHTVSQMAIAGIAAVVGDFDGALRGELACLEELRGQDEPYWTTVAIITSGLLETAMGRHEAAVGHLREARGPGGAVRSRRAKCVVPGAARHPGPGARAARGGPGAAG